MVLISPFLVHQRTFEDLAKNKFLQHVDYSCLGQRLTSIGFQFDSKTGKVPSRIFTLRRISSLGSSVGTKTSEKDFLKIIYIVVGEALMN